MKHDNQQITQEIFDAAVARGNAFRDFGISLIKRLEKQTEALDRLSDEQHEVMQRALVVAQQATDWGGPRRALVVAQQDIDRDGHTVWRNALERIIDELSHQLEDQNDEPLQTNVDEKTEHDAMTESAQEPTLYFDASADRRAMSHVVITDGCTELHNVYGFANWQAGDAFLADPGPREVMAVFHVTDVTPNHDPADVTRSRTVDVLTATSNAVLDWLAAGETGASSRCMAFWLTWGKRTDDSHPWDTGDVRRCMGLLDAAPGLRERLPRMADLSPVWAVLIAEWPAIELAIKQSRGQDARALIDEAVSR